MKKLIVLPFIFLLLTCAKSDNPETFVDLESILGVAKSDSPLGEGLFFEDINYGDGERQQVYSSLIKRSINAEKFPCT